MPCSLPDMLPALSALSELSDLLLQSAIHRYAARKHPQPYTPTYRGSVRFYWSGCSLQIFTDQSQLLKGQTLKYTRGQTTTHPQHADKIAFKKQKKSVCILCNNIASFN